jgi:hypothetical protein
MKNIRELLQDADPLRQEPATSPEQRDVQRKALLAAASSARGRGEGMLWSRATFFILVAAIVIVGLFLGERVWSPLVRDVHAAVRFEVRLAEDSPGPGLLEAKVFGTDRSIYLHDEVIVTNGDISAARVIHVGAAYKVAVEFNPAGAKKMHEATGRHIGEPIAVLLDGQVIMAPVLRARIETSAEINGNFTKAEAEKVVSGITGAP